MPQEITQAQGLWLDLIRISSFNEFDGDKVVDDLLANPDLWTSVIMLQEVPLLTLRDLPNDYNNVDTIFISTTADKKAALKALAQGWNADSIGWDQQSAQFMGSSDPVLFAWWD